VLFDVDFVNSLIRRDYSVLAGKNLTIPCENSDNGTISVWTRDGNTLSSNTNVIISLVTPFNYGASIINHLALFITCWRYTLRTRTL
jgi:hypothetical protein